MTRPSPAAVMLLASLGCGLLDPAATRLKEGKALADEGKYDDAKAALREIEMKWPDSPEASLVPGLLLDIRLDETFDHCKAGNFDQAWNTLSDLAPDEDPPDIDELPAKFQGREPAICQALNPSLDLGEKAAVWRTAKDDDLRAKYATWWCGIWAPSGEYRACASLPEKLSTADAPTLKAALHDGQGCSRFAALAEMCPGEMAAALSFPSDDALRTAWEAASAKEAKATRRQLDTVGNSCLSLLREGDRVANQMAQLLDYNSRFMSVSQQMARLKAAEPLSAKKEALYERAKAKREEIDKVGEGLKDRPWPDAVRNSVQADVEKWHEKCGGDRTW